MARNEKGSTKQDFNAAVKAAQDSLSGLLSAVFVTGETLGQALRRSKMRQEELDSLRELAQGLDRTTQTLYQQNQQLVSPSQASHRTKENIKTALLGRRLTQQSEEKAREVSLQMDKTLTQLVTQAKQARITQVTPESESTQQFKKKP